MDVLEIEKYIMKEMNISFGRLISEAVESLNSKGYSFLEDDNDIELWRDEENNLVLDVSPILCVSCLPDTINPELSEHLQEQKRIEDKFYELAEEGAIQEITILAEFEAEIANGGFDQLFINKGLKFLQKTIAALSGISSKNKLRLAKEALEIIESNAKNIQKYSSYLKALDNLDIKYEKSNENIPIIYNKKRNLTTEFATSK